MSVLTAYDKFIQQALKYGFSLWGLPKTTQTVVYRTGDDGTYQKGYPRTGPRFTDNGDGTITDNATGLMWVQDPSQCGGNFGSPGSPAKMNWAAAIDECLALTYAGHSDWRLPNVLEIASVQDYSRTSPSIDPIFTNTESGNYWTSTTWQGITTWVFVGLFSTGGIISNITKVALWYTRPVRLGSPPD